MKTYNVYFAKKNLCVALIIFCSFTNYSLAQNKKMEILLENSNDSIKCGIQNQTLQTPAILTLRNNRIDYTTNNTDPYLYINSQALKINSEYCTYNLTVQIRKEQIPIAYNGFKSILFESVILCNSSIIGGVYIKDITKNVSESVEDAIKICLTKIEY